MDAPTTKDAIEALRKRPAMFLRRNSVLELSTFLTGYCFGLDVASPTEFPHGQELRAFRRWLAARLGGSEKAELDSLLLTASKNNDAEAFRMFFDYWDEFLAAECDA